MKAMVILIMLLGVIMVFSEEQYNKLTDAEKYVIEEKGTEKPFTGKYYDHYDEGIYKCKKCGQQLFTSNDKFNSECGWPSFDDAIEDAVHKQKDADGRRTEIVCSNCGAHLGHVFKGEKFTPKDTRFCVNSISLNFSSQTVADNPNTDLKQNLQKAYFAGGCFWGMEYHFAKLEGVISTEVGYTGGNIEDPGYKEVCSGVTGHAEAIEVVFEPSKISYEKLAKLFFEIHDPTQVDRQGPDIGEQYRSAIFYIDNAQKTAAEKLIKILENKGLDVVTALVPTSEFYPAEDYHQDYYQKNGKKPYCHIYKKRFDD